MCFPSALRPICHCAHRHAQRHLSLGGSTSNQVSRHTIIPDSPTFLSHVCPSLVLLSSAALSPVVSTLLLTSASALFTGHRNHCLVARFPVLFPFILHPGLRSFPMPLLCLKGFLKLVTFGMKSRFWSRPSRPPALLLRQSVSPLSTHTHTH